MDLNKKLTLSANRIVGGLQTIITSRGISSDARAGDEKLVGFVVDDVRKASEAEAAGLMSGDFVVKVTSQPQSGFLMSRDN